MENRAIGSQEADAVAAPIDQERRPWRRLVGLFVLAAFVEGAFAAHVMVFLPLHLTRLGLAEGGVGAFVGAITSLSGAAGVMLLPLWGALADRYDRKALVVRSYVVYFVAAAIMLAAADVWTVGLGRALMGLALGNTGLMLATLAERVPSARAGLAFGLMTAALPAGSLVGPLLGGFIVDAVGPAGVLGVDVVALGATTLLLAIGYRDHFTPSASGSVAAMARDSVVALVRLPAVGLHLVALTVFFSGWLTLYTYLPIILAERVADAHRARLIGLVMAAGGAGTVICAPLLGLARDRFGHARTFIVAAAGAVALFAACGVAPDVVTLGMIWGLLSGVATGLYSMSLVVFVGSIPLAMRGRLMSYVKLPTIGGLVLGPGLASVLTGGNVQAVFPLAGALSVIGLGLLVYCRRMRSGGNASV
jgi:MFS transporter, DHA1 family, multidrug resistance protein